MVRETRTHLEPADPARLEGAPRSITRDEFGRRLYRLMISKGWNQSELARRAELNRDAVSTYVRGISFPTPANLQKLSDALGVEREALLPNTINNAIERDNPEMELKTSPARPKTAYIRINRQVSLETALKVFELINADKLVDAD